MPPPTLYLVDGYALIYRAFFAMIARPLTTRRGENTSAAWGVTNFLLRLLERRRPDYLGWVHDMGVSFRHETYAEYKATREKLTQELQQDFDRSVERIEQILEAFGVPVVGVDGYEADDVIGTLATAGVAQGLEVVIVSGDKDFYQLIGPGVALLNPGRGGPAAVEEHWVDQSNASNRLGVPPERVVDYLALVGDSSDNVPGVKGVGEKTALELLSTFGDLDAILANAERIAGKRAREAVLQHADLARLSRELVTIRRDVPVALDLEALRVRPPDVPRLTELFTELEFRSLIPKLASLQVAGAGAPAPAAPRAPVVAAVPAPATAAPGALAAVTAEPTIVDDPAALAAVVAECRRAPLVALDTETTSLDPMRAALVGMSLAGAPGRSWYLPFAHVAPDGELAGGVPPRNLPPLASDALRPLRALLADPAVPKAGHNVKYDWLVLRRAGVDLAGVAYDSMLASFVLDPGRRSHAIDVLASERLSLRMRTYQELVGRGRAERSFAAVPLADAARYCAADSETVLRLRDAFRPELEDHQLVRLLETIEVPLIPVLVEMEWHGVLVDLERLGEIARAFTHELAELEQTIYRVAGAEFNINSTPQLRHVLFEKHQLPVLKRTKTGASTDYDVLEQLAAMGHEVPRLLIEYRELSKLKSTYVDALPGFINPATGRIHTSFNQTGAATGRLSSSEPNLQNIPVRTPRGETIRRAFVAPPGAVLVTADYSQIELRLLAHLSGDPAFVQAFEQGGDIHRQTAAIIFGVPQDQVTAEMRARAKTINFGTIYGQGSFALSRQLGITQDEAKEFIREYFARFAGVRAWLDRTVAEARQRGYVETLFGRRRYIPELKDRNFNIRAFGERTATNSPLQGSAADLIKIAMIGIAGALTAGGLASRMILQVHDELVLEVPEPEQEPATELVKRHMETAASLRVPLVVSIGVGRNWVDAKG
ncbi:MAG: DNA polymerase I [Gemmatimonadetes bacterium 13_2_20CM_70_9]|nr:MAG: DNA polymerase I [Gemmatimonadetes bacterium 13_2_20CM_70_9]